MPEIRRITASEPDFACVAAGNDRWIIAEASLKNFLTGQDFGDGLYFLPAGASSPDEKVTDLSAVELATTLTLNAFLVERAGNSETWYSQKTLAEMEAIGLTVNKWAYAYLYEGGAFYPILGEPCSEGLCLQLQAIFMNDATLQSLVKTFKHEEFSDFRIPLNEVPLLLFVASYDWEHPGESVGFHALDLGVFIAFYQGVQGDHAAMGDIEKKVRRRIATILLIENPRVGEYVSEESLAPIDERVNKEIENWRGKRFRRLVVPYAVSDKIEIKSANRIY